MRPNTPNMQRLIRNSFKGPEVIVYHIPTGRSGLDRCVLEGRY